MKLISIGQMAQTYHISTRTLRLYHEKGLLTPEYVDPLTGYRYYAPAQADRLEVILQMRAMGLSLTQISAALSTENRALVEGLLQERLEEIERQMRTLAAERSGLVKKLANCRALQEPLPSRPPYLAPMEERRVLRIPLDEPYDLRREDNGLLLWPSRLEEVREKMRRQGVPLAHFANVGCIVHLEDLQQGIPLCSEAFIFTEEDLPGSVPLPAGQYLCKQIRLVLTDREGCRAEGMELLSLSALAGERGLQIAGDYFGEVLAEASIFEKSGYDMFVCMQIPVRPIVDEDNRTCGCAHLQGE